MSDFLLIRSGDRLLIRGSDRLIIRDNKSSSSSSLSSSSSSSSSSVSSSSSSSSSSPAIVNQPLGAKVNLTGLSLATVINSGPASVTIISGKVP